MIHCVLLMAGEGSRFRTGNENISKPFIDIKGRPMFLRAMDSLEGRLPQLHWKFCVRAIDRGHFERLTKELPRSSEIQYFPKTTRGPLETAYLSASTLPEGDSVIFLDCDLHFQSRGLFQFIKDHHASPVAAVPTFSATDPRYSFVLAKNGKAVAFAEKKSISNQAVAGCYYFSSLSDFKAQAQSILMAETQEPFFSHLLQKYISQGKEVCTFPTTDYVSFGTPEEIELSIERLSTN